MPNKKTFTGVGNAKFDKPDQDKHVSGLAKNLAILTGQTRNKEDRAVLYRDLKKLGLISAGGNFIDIGTAASGGGGGGSGGTPNPATEQPTKPTNVTAEAAFTTVMIRWDFPTYAGHKHAEIWRNTVDTLGDMIDPRLAGEAALIATTPDSLYVDSVNFNTGYYYWVRFINVDDEPGPVSNASGVFAQTLQDINQSIADIEAYIDAEILTLDTNFNLALDAANLAIQGAADKALDAENRAIAADNRAIDARDRAIAADGRATAIQDDITTRINVSLTTNSDNIALLEQGISSDLSSNYYTITETDFEINGRIDTFRTTYVDTNFVSNAFIGQNYYTQAGVDGAIAGQITTFQSTVLTPNYKTAAQINLDHYTKSDADGATAGQIQTFNSTVLAANYKTAAQINLDHYTKATTDSAIAGQIQTFESTVLTPNYKTTAEINLDHYTKAEADVATAGQLQTFESTVITPNYKTAAQINIDHYTKADADVATAGLITNFESTVLTPNYKTAAEINIDHYTKATTDSAISTQVNSLKSQIFDTDGVTVSGAFIDEVRISQSDLDGAIATGVDSYEVTYGGQTYSLDQVTRLSVDSDNQYSLQWGVKTTVGDLSLGIGFINNNGVTTFAASADNFAVYNPANNDLELAFAVVNGEIVAKKALIGSAQIRELIVQEKSVFEGEVLVNSKLTGARIHGAKVSANQLWVQGGSNALSFSPTGNYAMWYGSNSFYNPDAATPIDDRTDGNAKFAIKHDGKVLARGIDIYTDSGDLIMSANGVYEGSFFAKGLLDDIYDAELIEVPTLITLTGDQTVTVFSVVIEAQPDFNRKFYTQVAIDHDNGGGSVSDAYIELYLDGALEASILQRADETVQLNSGIGCNLPAGLLRYNIDIKVRSGIGDEMKIYPQFTLASVFKSGSSIVSWSAGTGGSPNPTAAPTTTNTSGSDQISGTDSTIIPLQFSAGSNVIEFEVTGVTYTRTSGVGTSSVISTSVSNSGILTINTSSNVSQSTSYQFQANFRCRNAIGWSNVSVVTVSMLVEATSGGNPLSG